MSGLEIVGTFAAAGQFVGVLVKTVELVKLVVDQVQEAPGQIQQQLGRLESFKSLAEQIRDTRTLQTDYIEKILSRCEGHVQSLHQLLPKISFQHHDAISRKTWRAICGLTEEENILNLLNQLDQEYNLLNTHINLHTLAMTETLHTGVHSIDSKIRRMAQAADSTPDSAKCLQDLFITDPVMDRAELITSKGELVLGTCDWITQRKEFFDWQASNGGLLWISGGPGLGKTMLSIYLTEYLSSCFRYSDNANGHLSMYFFCDAKDNTRNNAVAILRGLLFQLLEHDMDLIKHILPSYQIQQQRLFGQDSLEALWDLFLRMVNSPRDYSQVTCVLDGLDECEPASLEPLLTKMKNITSTAPRLRLIVLSREYPECLGTLLGRFLRVRLDPDAKTEVTAGLEQYISTRVAELSERRQYPDELASHVEKVLRVKSAGTYLWVSFVIKDLQTMKLSEVEESLDKLPRGLDALYERILDQIEPTRRDTTLDILRWSTFAVRPLSLREMAGALEIQPTEHLNRVTVLRGKLAYCGHLINTANDAVTLVHQSAYDFLTRRLFKSKAASWYSLSQAEIEHAKLASRCISYFSKGCFEGGDIRKLRYRLFDQTHLRYPFFDYAGLQWVDHFKHSGQQGSKLLDNHSEFFSIQSRLLRAWAIWMYGYRILQLPPIAAQHGLTGRIQRIINGKHGWMNLKHLSNHYPGTRLLHIAAEYGTIPLVDMLIKAKADVNAKGEGGCTPLHIAAYFMWVDVVDMLIKNKAHVNAKEKNGSTPLHIAAERGWVRIVDMLIEKKAQVNAMNQLGNTPLHLAALGRLDVVKLLVENRAHIDSCNYDGQTPLCQAVGRSELEIAEHLLKCGANVNGSKAKHSPMLLAARKGDSKAVELLLDWGADYHMRESDGSS